MAHQVVISDLHLGQSFALGQFKDFLADLRKRVRPEMLILGGDILELAWFSWEELEAQRLFRDALDELRAFAGSIETIYLPGNHDPYSKIPKDEVSPMHVVAPPAGGTAYLDLNGVIFTHGNQFDVTTHVWDSLLKLPLKRLLPWLYVKMYGTPYEVRTKRSKQEFLEYVGWVTGRAAMEAIRQGKDLCFGHTHWPVFMDLGGRVVVNSGDWRDSNSFILVEDGKMSLKFWRP